LWIKNKHLKLDAVDVCTSGYAYLHAASSELAIGNLGIKRKESEFNERVCNIPLRLGLPTGYFLKNEDALTGLTDRLKRIVGPRTTLEKQMRLLKNAIEEGGFPNVQFTTPHSLLKDGYSLLKDRASYQGLIELYDFWVLMLIGLACEGLLEMSLCKFCPRWAIPGNKLCTQHTVKCDLPSSLKTTVSERSKNYRLGRLVASRYNYFFTEIPAEVKVSATTLSYYLQCFLWNHSLSVRKSLREHIQHQIDESDRIKEWLGVNLADLPVNDFFQTLKDNIDPYEFRPSVWKWKLKRIRLWLRFEEQALSQPKKKATKSWILIVKASGLERKGFSKAEIAKFMKISPSTISNWLVRYNENSISDIVETQVRKMSNKY